jgi:hypothetical protein
VETTKKTTPMHTKERFIAAPQPGKERRGLLTVPILSGAAPEPSPLARMEGVGVQFV